MIETLSQGLADEGMPEQMLTETLMRVRSHPWWIARARLALEVLRRNGIVPPATVIDVGCGWGVTLDCLEAAGYTSVGVDISRKILERIDRSARHLIEADLRKPLSPLAGKADAILLLDVIEHVDDDRQVVGNCAQLLKPCGLAVVSVPARPDLFSEFDQIQGHRRQYLPEDLERALSNTGMTVQQVFWWGEWMVPLLRRRRKSTSSESGAAARTYADYLRLPPWPGPWLMRLAYLWEQPRTLLGRLRTGTSLFAIARRS
jgi:SAM-dependent methyltransferase